MRNDTVYYYPYRKSTAITSDNSTHSCDNNASAEIQRQRSSRDVIGKRYQTRERDGHYAHLRFYPFDHNPSGTFGRKALAFACSERRSRFERALGLPNLRDFLEYNVR